MVAQLIKTPLFSVLVHSTKNSPNPDAIQTQSELFCKAFEIQNNTHERIEPKDQLNPDNSH